MSNTVCEEFWLPVVGHETLYQISSYGRLRRIWPPQYGKPARYTELTGWSQESGHIVVQLSQPRRDTHMHVLVAEAFLGPKNPRKPWVLHHDDDPSNNRLDNLRWGTPKENYADAVRNGKKTNGVRQKVKTHCPRNHALEEPNLSASHKGRQCLACHQTAVSAWGQRVRRKEGISPMKHSEFKERADAAYRAIMGIADDAA